MKPLINDLKILQSEGICFNFDGCEILFKGIIATISADNLASLQIGGFRQSYSSCKICRFCLADYNTMNNFVTEEGCVIRTASMNKTHVQAVQNDKSLSKTYGVWCQGLMCV